MQRRRFLRSAAVLGGTVAAAHPVRAAEKFDEGIDYQVLRQPLPVAQPGKPQVLELFWYSCPHCHLLEPLLDAWRARHTEVMFSRLPAVLGDSWAVHARAYYAAESLGLVERMHKPLFDAIHAAGRRLDDEASLAAFAASLGADAQRFRDAMRAFTVDAKVRQAAAVGRQIGLDGVPAMVVNGRFLTSPTLAGSRQRAVDMLDFLVTRT